MYTKKISIIEEKVLWKKYAVWGGWVCLLGYEYPYSLALWRGKMIAVNFCQAHSNGDFLVYDVGLVRGGTMQPSQQRSTRCRLMQNINMFSKRKYWSLGRVGPKA